jgi:pyruvate dehydrogenase phosphatase regulatory subunit
LFILGKQYSLKYPTYGMSLYRTGRKLRVSALHPKLEAAGAAYGEVLGYERPLFFNSDEAGKSISIKTKKNLFCFYFCFSEDFDKLSKQGTFGKPRWFNTVKKEYNVCRKSVAVIDMTSFTKYELKSANRSVVDFLQMLCANNIDKPIGTVVHTGMLNEQGGYENDCSVIRLGEFQ